MAFFSSGTEEAYCRRQLNRVLQSSAVPLCMLRSGGTNTAPAGKPVEMQPKAYEESLGSFLVTTPLRLYHTDDA